MKIILVAALICSYATLFAQDPVGKYHDYFGTTLEIKKDSTFRFVWRFDLAHCWAIGQWSLAGKRIHLSFINVYDTVKRENTMDSLVLSIDEKSDSFTGEEYGSQLLTSMSQRKEFFPRMLFRRGNKLYVVNERGQVDRRKRKRIWAEKRRLWGYKRWPTYFKKIS